MTIHRAGSAYAMFLFSAMLLLSNPAHAGRSCETKPLISSDAVQGLTLAERTVDKLEALSVRVVLIGRIGQDLRQYGQRYSHFGFAYKDGAAWRVVHKLNGCGTDRAALYRQGLGDFFLDTPFDYEAAIVVLSPEVQERLLPLLSNNSSQIRAMNTPAYSMVAYAWGQTYQQSNQWALETLAMAMSADVDDRSKAQHWLQLKGYQPGEIHLPTLTRLGARLTAANVSFDDHPLGLRMAGKIRTVTVDSVFAWVRTAGLGQPVIKVR